MWERVTTRVADYLPENSLLKRITENFSWLFVERIVLMGISFLVGIWLVRYLGPEDYGKYSYALSFAGLFGAVAHLGMNSVAVREMSRDRHSDDRVFWTTAVIKAVGAFIAFAAAAVAVWIVDDEPLLRLLVVISALAYFFKPSEVVKLWFQSEIQSKYVVWARTGSTLLANGLKIAALLLALPLIAFVSIKAFQAVLLAVGLIAVFLRWGPSDWSFEFDMELARKMLSDSWPLIIAGLSVAVYMKIDRVMLGNIVDQQSVGIYSAAAQISELWYFIPTLAASTVFPLIAKLSDSDDQVAYHERMQMLYDGMAFFSYAIALPLTFLATPVIVLLFGPEYTGAGAILQIHIWALIFVALGTARGKYLVAENFTRFSMITTVIGALVNVAINLLLIPSFSGVGAAWATLISYATAGWITCYFFAPIRGTGVQMTKAIFLPIRLRSATHNVKTIIQ